MCFQEISQLREKVASQEDEIRKLRNQIMDFNDTTAASLKHQSEKKKKSWWGGSKKSKHGPVQNTMIINDDGEMDPESRSNTTIQFAVGDSEFLKFGIPYQLQKTEERIST